jgi:hypothetical protein
MIDVIWEGSISPDVEIVVDPAPLAAALQAGLSTALPDGPLATDTKATSIQPAGVFAAVPPTLPASWWQYLPQPWLPQDRVPILREQTVDLRRPLVPGERLICHVRLDRLRRRGSYEYLTCTLVARSGPELVAEATSRLVVRV